MELKIVTQEQGAGCAIACIASILGTSYKNVLKLFDKNRAPTRGYYSNEIVSALRKKGLNYKYAKLTNKTKKYLEDYGSIVFIKRSKKYPLGHYLLKTKRGWMNSWINFPNIKPAKSGFQKKLPGKAQWVIYSKHSS